MTGTDPVLAIDIGGTKLAAALIDSDAVRLRRAQVPTTPCGAGKGEELWSTLAGLVTDVVGGNAISGVGIGCGGPMAWSAGIVSPLNIPAWRDFALRERVAELCPGVPVRLANDAIAASVGEHWRGVGRGTANLLGMVVSTGVGGGLVIAGRVVFGATGNAGHIGHVVVDPDGPVCACGGIGCLEAIARGPAVVQYALDNGWRVPDAAVADGATLASAARAGDDIALRAFRRAGTAVGVAIASAAHLLELEAVAIGGGLANAGDLLVEPVRDAFARHARMGFATRCRIEPAALGGDAGLVGAAALVSCGDRYWTTGAD